METKMKAKEARQLTIDTIIDMIKEEATYPRSSITFKASFISKSVLDKLHELGYQIREYYINSSRKRSHKIEITW